ncbi:alpha-D-ribose 1-methylphosphonate 5-triphosphate diphosphatase [Halomontanus rarus]|uniref:alpha-D-ribose 1-methylphosphonate 5-triphosphate diphosphatase n=1 Tax=Halomontanus rarus TaxID=3034020 RepID=UPI0023E8883F|nr:alpha-D-ribose 1-methylphosphonate 5-triphosphate diphosphatase [Halovivax sp. TS33]
MSSPSQRGVGESTAVLENARLVTPDDVVSGSVRIEGDRIVDVGDVERSADTVVDVGGRLVLPGLVDLHGDDIESHLHPRSGARVGTHMALAAADRANVAAGITTKFHAISFELDPDENRSPELGAEITDAVDRADDLVIDHRIHARCEVTQSRCIEAVEDVVAAGDAALVSVMSHIPGKGQFRDQDAFIEYYRDSQKHTIEEAEAIIDERGGLELETVRERVTRVVEAAAERGVPTASHDDEDVGEVERLREIGVDVSEYPITLETAERAHELGMTVTMGAPNLVRGESQWGNLRTADAIDAGVVDALVADYHPPSLLAATFVDTGEPLPTRVRRVTANPADAAGLDDRGRIEPGARADLVVVDRDPTPTVARALVGGRPAYRAEVGDVDVEGSR